MRCAKQSGRLTPNVRISKTEAGDLLRIAAAIAFSAPDDSLLLQRIAKEALHQPRRPPGENFERDLWTTIDYLISGDSVKVVDRRWGEWGFTAKRASQMKSKAKETIATNPDANWLKVVEAQMREYKATVT